MTKGDARKLTLRWLDSATVNGSPLSSEISADFNDKFDYFLYQGLNYLYGVFREEDIFIPLQKTETVSSYSAYILPEKLRSIKKVICTDDNGYFEVTDYKIEGKNRILIPEDYKNIRILYYTNCEYISPFESDDKELILSDNISFLLPLKVALDISSTSEDTFSISSYLSDKFGSFVANILDENIEEPRKIQTLYEV